MEFNKEAFVSAIVGALNACTYSESFYLPIVDKKMEMIYDYHEKNSVASIKPNIDSDQVKDARVN